VSNSPARGYLLVCGSFSNCFESQELKPASIAGCSTEKHKAAVSSNITWILRIYPIPNGNYRIQFRKERHIQDYMDLRLESDFKHMKNTRFYKSKMQVPGRLWWRYICTDTRYHCTVQKAPCNQRDEDQGTQPFHVEKWQYTFLTEFLFNSRGIYFALLPASVPVLPASIFPGCSIRTFLWTSVGKFILLSIGARRISIFFNGTGWYSERIAVRVKCENEVYNPLSITSEPICRCVFKRFLLVPQGVIIFNSLCNDQKAKGPFLPTPAGIFLSDWARIGPFKQRAMRSSADTSEEILAISRLPSAATSRMHNRSRQDWQSCLYPGCKCRMLIACYSSCGLFNLDPISEHPSPRRSCNRSEQRLTECFGPGAPMNLYNYCSIFPVCLYIVLLSFDYLDRLAVHC